jgi:hypothetical protein
MRFAPAPTQVTAPHCVPTGRQFPSLKQKLSGPNREYLTRE